MLEKMGIASLRFDFAGSGESDGDFRDMTLTGELLDANKILDYARTLSFVDKDRISVVGLSMGGAVASMLCAGRKDHVHSLCLWAPAGNMGEIVVDNFIGDSFAEYERKGFHDVEGLTIGINFVEDVKGMDICQRSAGYDKNILLIHGDVDEVVSIKASEKYVECYGSKASLKVLSGADHTFNKKEWEEQVLEDTVEFLTSPEN
jgi:alpha/beta superfamily hydrolase